MRLVNQLDLLDASTFDPEPPHAAFAELRGQPGLYRHPEPDGPGFWVATRHADVAFIHHHAEVFSSGGGLMVPRLDPFIVAMTNTMLVGKDAPEHTRLRRLISSAFTPRAVARLESLMAAYVTNIVERVRDRDQLDLVDDIAVELPLNVIADVLGVPASERQQLFGWTVRSFGHQDAEGNADLADQADAISSIIGFGLELLARKRAHPEDDIATALLEVEVNGERLTDEQIVGFFLLLNNAGIETSSTLIARGVLLLLEHPDELARLAADPGLSASAVEEMLRCTTPFLHFARTATETVEVAGTTVETGEMVTVWYPSSNRDEAVFGDPMRVDIGRHPNPHQSFGGGGAHYCLGAALTRIEARLLFEQLPALLVDATVDGPVAGSASTQNNGVRAATVKRNSPS